MCRSLAGCSAERAQSAVEPRRKIAMVSVPLWHRTVKGLQGGGSMCTRRVSAAGGRVWPFQAHTWRFCCQLSSAAGRRGCTGLGDKACISFGC